MRLDQSGMNDKNLSAQNGFHRLFARPLLLILTVFSLIWALSPSVVATTGQAGNRVSPIPADLKTPLGIPPGRPVPEIDGSAFVLYDATSQTFLLGENQNEKRSPASITKVMTALLVLENLRLSDEITVTCDMFTTIPNDYTRLGLVEGEIITVEEALQASLLISANDAAMALALAMDGTEEAFAARMNERARELGCNSTHFTNPYGLADPEHLTSASDMALITAAALEHAFFRETSTSKHILLQPTNQYPQARGLPNGNRFIATEQYAYEPYIGGKTGYTRLSRYTIVGGAEKEGNVLVAVILGASNAPVRYADLTKLFDYGFESYQTMPLDLSAASPLVEQTVRLVEQKIKQQNMSLTVAATQLQLDEHVTNHRSSGGFLLAIDDRSCEPQAELDKQVLNCPLYTQYDDNSRRPVGLLSITLEQNAVEETTSTWAELSPSATRVEQAYDDKPEITAGKVVLIVILGLILIFCFLLLVAMIRHDLRKKRRKNRKTII